MAIIRIITVVLFLVAVGCEDDPPYGPTGGGKNCWMWVDTLFVSHIPIEDTTDVRTAFEAYVAFVDTTGGEFPDGETHWRYRDSRYYMEWRDRHYWQVDHRSHHPDYEAWMWRRKVYVDENGVVVWPFGCI